MSQNESLSPKQQRLVECLLAGNSVLVAAKACGIGRATATRWLKDHTFQAVYREAKQRIFDERLDELENHFFEILSTHLKADTEPTAATQIAAMRLWFEMRQQSRYMKELEEAFEQWRAAQKHNGYAVG